MTGGIVTERQYGTDATFCEVRVGLLAITLLGRRWDSLPERSLPDYAEMDVLSESFECNGKGVFVGEWLPGDVFDLSQGDSDTFVIFERVVDEEGENGDD